jgi:Xaa-Pro aminopeptidase
MFPKELYIKRREQLMKLVNDGIILLFGNKESSMNYASNTYPFRQDSNFLYYTGIDIPDLAFILDTQTGEQTLYGNDPDIEDIIWMGYLEPLKERAKKSGIENVKPLEKMSDEISKARATKRKIHFLPPYREERKSQLLFYLNINFNEKNNHFSEDLIKAIVAQRSVKDELEIAEIDSTLTEVTKPMYLNAMKMAKSGLFEYEISGMIEGMALQRDLQMAYPVICSVHGEILHNHYHGNCLDKGQLLLIDAGAESKLHYATDITRTIPVDGIFSPLQKDIYNIVLKAETECIANIRPGIPYKDIHMKAAAIIAEGLKSVGLMKGNIEDIISTGAHALFFPHGIGHMLGLDVHDMEDIGEKFVGYDNEFQRSDQFGLAYLRMARRLKPGFVVTVEPGIYFIPPLIDKWESEKKFADFINYSEIKFFKDIRGIRIEDNVLVTSSGNRVLGQPIPKTVAEVEQACKV